MFCAYVGRPGSGKSYDAVRRIVHNLRIGRTVATNIDGMQEKKHQAVIKELAFLDDEKFHKQFIFLQKEDITNFWLPRAVNEGTAMEFTAPLVPSGALVVLDEVHKWINSREWNSAKNKAFAEWGAEHRHDGYDVILITQDIDKIDKQVRSLVEFTYYYRKVNFFGSLVKRRYIKYSYDGDDHDGKPVSPPSTYTYNARYYKCYKSYKLPQIAEKDFQTHVNVLKHPLFFALPVVLAWGIYSVSKSSLASGDLFGSKKMLARGESIKKGATDPNLPPPVGPAKVALPPPPPPLPVPGPVASSSTFNNHSSAVNFVSPDELGYSLVRFGYVSDGETKVILIGKVMVRLPSPYVQHVDFRSRVCEVKTNYLKLIAGEKS